MPGTALRLEVTAFTDADTWRWRLTEAGGAFLEDHSVGLDRNDPHYPALIDLPGYLRYHSAPDSRDADERRLIGEIGAWIGEHILGKKITTVLQARGKRQVVVRVLVPPAAQRLLTLPLEIARLDGDPLARSGVSFVFESKEAQPPPAEPIGERLRMLALFSLPPVGSPLNLRHERQKLRSLVRSLAGGGSRLAIDLHVLQYGVTRTSLEDVLQQGEGWDIIHFSGHGQPGSLLLEKPDGTPDEITAADLAKLLAQATGRVKLVTLSACLSAAASIDQTLNWLGLSPDAAPRRDTPGRAAPEPVTAAPTVARALTEALDCAVLAMRYAVEDEFAIKFAEKLYDGLFRQKQSLPLATRLALAGASGAGALSVAAPALFGAKAADLMLLPPKQSGFERDLSLALVPKQPEHFVGRVRAMTRASAALADQSRRSGVLFHGMAGAGKTSCAVELVYHHQAAARFRTFVWYSAPEQGKDIALALRDFALLIEKHLELRVIHVIDRIDDLRGWLPILVEALEKEAVLLVLDNLESLLTEDGHWRDERWGLLVPALLTEGGLSRTLLTSRIRPAGLPASAEVIPVHALPRDEALLLVRELPNLRRLLDGRAAADAASGRDLVRRVLRLVQGHPKLLELAEALAADPARLAARLDQADAAQTAGAGELDGFFAEDDMQRDAASFTAALRDWTGGIAGALPEASRIFFHFLCALEERDRRGSIIARNWSPVWRRLGRPAPAPEAAGLLAALIAAALVDRRTMPDKKDDYEVLIHAGVAEAGWAEAGVPLRDAVDHELAGTWRRSWARAAEVHGKEPWAGPALVHAGLAAFPYLNRRGEWPDAAWMLERVVVFDHSPATIVAVLSLIQRLAPAARGTDLEAPYRSFLAKVLGAAGRVDEAETLLRENLAETAARGDFSTASSSANDLANLLHSAGRFTEALQVLEQKAEHTRLAGRGPWSQLSDEVQRLQNLNALGKQTEALSRVTELITHMQGLPDPPDASDWAVAIWDVREMVLGVGAHAARDLGHWQQALDLTAKQLRWKTDRGAEPFECARFRFNDYGPLLRLERYTEAEQLLNYCKTVFEQENAVAELGRVFSALAALEGGRGRFDAAKRFEETALRYKYERVTPEDAAISHFAMAEHLNQFGRWPDVLAHRLAAVLIRAATESGKLSGSIAALAGDLVWAGDAAASAVPADIASLCATVQQIPGVRFHALIERLMPGEERQNQTLEDMLARASEINKSEPPDQGPGETGQ